MLLLRPLRRDYVIKIFPHVAATFIMPWSWQQIYIFISALSSLHCDFNKYRYFSFQNSLLTTPWSWNFLSHCYYVHYTVIMPNNFFPLLLLCSLGGETKTNKYRFFHFMKVQCLYKMLECHCNFNCQKFQWSLTCCTGKCKQY